MNGAAQAVHADVMIGQNRMMHILTRAGNRLRRIRYSRDGFRLLNEIARKVGHPAVTEDLYASLVMEARSDPELAGLYEMHAPRLAELDPRAATDWEGRFLTRGGIILAAVDLYYVLPRLLKPSICVETGVASGAMSSFLVAAIHRNAAGHLYSVDLRSYGASCGMSWSMPHDLEVGFLVPDAYRDRWSLLSGDATYELPRLLETLGRIDLFIHDSLHTYSHMMFEYALIAKHITPPAVIVTDDVTANQAFFRFFEGTNFPIYLHRRNPNLGVAVLGN